MIRATHVAMLAALGFAAACGSSSPMQPPNPGDAPCPSGSSTTTVSLDVGQVSALTSPAALDCVELKTAGGGSGTFLVMPANADPMPDVTGNYEINFAAPTSGDVTTTAANRVRPSASAVRTASLGLGADGHALAEGRFRALEQRSLRLAPGMRANVRSAMLRAQSLKVRGQVVPNVGDTISFKVPDATASNACTTFTTQKAVVKTVGTHGIIVQDVRAPAGGFNGTDFQSIESEFDNIIYPTDTVHFGRAPDIDNNGHVFLFFTPSVNAATAKGSQSILEGFFFAGDLFPSTGVNACAESNETEIFYLLVPDPTGTFSDTRSTSSVRQDIRGTIAHEFQHMINAGVRFIDEDAPDDAVWENEGLSHFAEELVGRAEDGFNDTQELAIDDIADFSDSLANFNAFFGQNLARLNLYLHDPSTLGATSAHADTSLAVRGAAWTLLRWSADHYASSTVAAFTRSLVAGPDTGVANLVAHAGAPFDSITAGWLPSLFTDDAGIPGLADRYTFPSWNMRDIMDRLQSNNGVYPLAAPTLSQNQPTTGSVSSATANYYTVAVPSSGHVTLGELDTNGGPVTFTGARLYIVRLQ